MQQQSTLNEGDVKRIEQLMQETENQTRLEKYNWTIEDKTLPQGWKSRKAGSKILFLSPENQQFFNRADILRHIHRNGYSQAMINNFRLGLIKERWLENSCLPETWRYKIKGAGTSTVTIDVLQPSGDIIKGSKKAWSLINTNCLQTEDSSSLKRFLESQIWLLRV